MHRFVILHHTLADSEHWDLMIEQGDTLATWQLQCDPLPSGTMPIPARRIDDHRMAYLDYEGPVSRDRGYVARVASGTCEILRCEPQHWVVVFTSRTWTGRFAWQALAASWQRTTDAP